MFVVDDALLCPLKGFFWLAREIHEAAIEESKNEAQTIRDELASLYRSLETRAISEAEFDARERVLLDRLEAIEPDQDEPDAADFADNDESDEEPSGGTQNRAGS